MNNPFSPSTSQSGAENYTNTMTPASFFSKVMFCFGLALLVSAAGVFTGFRFMSELFLTSPTFVWLFLILEMVLVFTARIWSTKRPLNYVLFAAFAFVTGITIAPFLASIILEFGGPDLIIKALMACTFTFTAAAVFGWITNYQLNGFRGFLWTALIGMIVVSLIGLFVPWNNNFEMFFSGFGILLFSGYTMYDIQRLKNYPSDRYIDAALNLYLDIFNLFIYILRLVSGASRRR